MATKQLKASNAQLALQHTEIQMMKDEINNSRAELTASLSREGSLPVDSTPGAGGNFYTSVFVKIRVLNTGKAMAKDCRAYLTSIEKKVGDVFREEPYLLDPVRLRWAYEPEETEIHKVIDVPSNINFHFDVLSTKDEPQPGNSKLVMIQAASSYIRYEKLKNVMEFGAEYKLTVWVVAENSEAAIITFHLHLRDMNDISVALSPIDAEEDLGRPPSVIS